MPSTSTSTLALLALAAGANAQLNQLAVAAGLKYGSSCKASLTLKRYNN